MREIMSKPATDVSAKLRAFAEAKMRGPGLDCSTCNLPPDVLEAIRSERERGTYFTVIADFLKTIGIHTNGNRLGHHFAHHEQRTS